ncbi:E3 ubiquitin-protein ligase KCMF1-like isoform X1 [Salvelinus fontinalis]|uniref:E3 ubiquitin-protein ligase KCMF1-like isoform X1 n=1 Tax=Salvelinus fontinalis TaxID=8038 RepID=UPI002484F4FA|nr:E3 ubiquitin-protein ligase KCMF1-like isoform X1 [Salvelinus fontinalis]
MGEQPQAFTCPYCLTITPCSSLPDLYYGGESFSVEQPQAFTCPYCLTITPYSSLPDLYYGGESFSVEQPQAFTCPYCLTITPCSSLPDLYYGGESFSVEQPQAFTCPYCGRMGYTVTSLQEHVGSEHTETSSEVICPICVVLPGGDPNHVTDDFAAHLTLEHRAPRDLDESSGVRHVRRMIHPGRGLGGQRARRSNMHFTSSTSGGSSTTQTSTQSSNREAMDPIGELLSQLSGVRRSAGSQLSSGPSASQLQQLQMQLQVDWQQTQATRQQLETARGTSQRGSRTSNHAGNHNANPGSNSFNNLSPNPEQQDPNTQSSTSQFLLNRLSEPRLSEAERQLREGQWADRSLFVTELLLSTLIANPDHSEDDDLRDYHDAVTRGSDAFAAFEDMGCVGVMTLDVALENLNLRELKNEQRPPALP